ncbi:hypothetical protein [Fluviispira multicolorata]|uniref:Lipoprotein n=1 Tax=Fluviispira multicolorata TaxID=2654512 RepID=A0A833N8A8_9BACT|nr:hypothetical protein [Fluviispira multicolorata]KAB8033776.1 hypothetical protein GCL57_03450 [Fluviispira multicolorata]
MKLKIIAYLLSALVIGGCSTFLSQNSKRGQNSSESRQSSSFFGNLFHDESDNETSEMQRENEKSSLNQETISRQNRRKNSHSEAPLSNQSMIAALNLTHIEGNTWRTAAHPALVFSIMARLLSQNYIISSVDRKNFNLQTDWDKFFIDGRLFRNRISIMVFPVGPRQTEVIAKNIVEYYSGNPNSKLEENTAWLPSPDITDEISKLVENTNRQTTLLLNQVQKVR